MPHRRKELTGHAHALLDAVVAISSDLDLASVLQRIVRAACELTNAGYGAIGVVGADGEISEFLVHGMDAETQAAIGAPPRGRGILGLLIKDPRPLRLHDLNVHAASYGFPANHPPMETFLGVPVRIRGTIFGNLYLTEKDGGEDFTETDVMLVEALASAAGFVIENARAYTLGERRRQWLQAAAELVDELQPPLQHDEALRRVARAASHVVRARGTAVVHAEDDPAEAADTAVIATVDDEEALRVELLALLQSVQGPVEDPQECRVGAIRALVVPLRSHLTGAALLITFFDEHTHALEAEERELLISFADQAALALDRAQAMSDRAQLAVIGDRERIARDLHDTVIQRLFATGLHLQGASMGTDDPVLAERIGKAVDDLDHTIRDIRGTIFELTSDGQASLKTRTRTLAREYARLLGHNPEVTIEGPVDTAVSPEVAEQVVPVLREALSNVSRHAKASRTSVLLHCADGLLVLEVADDGVGPGTPDHESGLRNARTRSVDLGGSFDLLPRDPQGTVFRWTVPLG
ncbi:GAF domain-containing sensor histidine kinase [Nocardioides bruguierae]|uniref:GAF domain-containing sensor histidine kinase n=1 Tax=Nocardioides bruguierae TaxID=2945102 RepID=UPI0020211D36|nr:GAF domain-containing protein [Nocardioides bruguierae]MCL8027212.1 GAF domain-containing protein [Nocardioides bruguierae]